jgi:hypothetical protein
MFPKSQTWIQIGDIEDKPRPADKCDVGNFPFREYDRDTSQRYPPTLNKNACSVGKI